MIAFWIALVAALGAVTHATGTAYDDSFTLPGTESTQALKLVKAAFPKQSGETDSIVWHVKSGAVIDPDTRSRITSMLEEVKSAPSIVDVKSPYEPAGATQISPDGATAYATISWAKFGQANPKSDIVHVIDLAKRARTSNIEVELGGQAIQASQQRSTNASTFFGVIIAAIILLIAFGAFFAMLLPLVSAIFSIVAGTLAIGLLSHVLTIGQVGPIFATLVGLGVGVDYALFIVTRHRNGLKAGLSLEESAIRALNTSGRAVLFAGATVVIAMLGLLVLRLNFLSGLGMSSALMVLFTVLTAITLLPAMLGVMGVKVLSRRERRELAAHGPHDVHSSGLWARWSAFVSGRPIGLSAAALIALVALTIPFFSLRLGSSDQGNDPASTTTRKAYDLLAQGFGPGFNGPLQLVAQVQSPSDQRALAGLVADVRHARGVKAAFAIPTRPGQKIALVQVFPTTSPQAVETTDLISRLRNDVIPAAEQGHTLKVYVGGTTAIFNDFARVLTDKLPLLILVIVGFGFLLLLVAFRSVVVPLTAAAMNLLAAGASFGVMVAFFQWGWGSEALGLGRSGPIDAFVPVLTLAVLFGLSMDYQVFLVSRMHEEWVHTRDNRLAVTKGQASTGRVITAAATIMICVFLAFVFEGQRVIAEFGIGLASAVFIDAFILRTVLVPALMHLFGKVNWWLPNWLDRILPHLSVEPADEAVAESSELVGSSR